MAYQFYLSFTAFWIISLLSSSHAQDVIFGNSDVSVDACTTKEGGEGRCVDIRKCPEIRGTFLTNPPVRCGFNGAFPIVCCPVSTEPVSEDPSHVPVPVLDISSPDFNPNFKCGRSAVKVLNDSPRFKRAFLKLEGRPLVPLNKPSVVGGITSRRNAWPWMALLGAREDGNINWFCAGALINDQWVLTAAHCFDEKTPQIVRLGEHDYTNDFDGANPKDFEIRKIISYPNYTFPVAYHDLALIQLSSKVIRQTFIAPACLPWGEESKKVLTNTKVKLAGWGDTESFGSPSSVLQEVDLTLFSNSKCQENYSELRQFQLIWPNGIGEETACAGDPNGGRDACQGDSGGPITYRSNAGRYTINGIVSRGYGCGHKDYPGIYTNVQYPSYLAWIKKVAFGRS